MSRVYDCFLAYNEWDVIELRLRTLKDVVDTFVIVQTSRTFGGEPNTHYRFERFKFKPWRDFKIIPVLTHLPPLEPGHEAPWGGRWPREYAMRNAIADALRPIARPDDYILISDADEIPDPQVVKERHLGTYMLKLYVYALNAFFDHPWCGTVGLEYRQLVFNTPQHFRAYNAQWPRRYNAGWHFSYMGGADNRREKVRAGGEASDDTAEKLAGLEGHAARLEDPFGRTGTDGIPNGRVVPLDDTFPPYLVQNQERFRDLLRPS